MASAEPLLPGPGPSKQAKHTKASILYGADEYLEQLSKKYQEYDELATLLQFAPDAAHVEDEGAKAAARKDGGTQMLRVELDESNRSKKTGRAIPTPNIPDPMPPELAFMFTKISPEQRMYMWNIYTLIFVSKCLWIVAYCMMLRYGEALGIGFATATTIYGVPMVLLTIQNVYILHDVAHGATFPPYDWQIYITHPFSDFISLPWIDLVMEHNRHHNSTFDLLNHGEFGWDPANWLYLLQELSFEWYGWLTVPLIPFWHFVGAHDNGGIFAILWWTQFPDAGPGGKCDRAFYTKWLPMRIKHNLFVWFCWACVWLLGSYGLNRPLSEGWRFVLWVSCFVRIGFSLSWIFIANFNHSHMWNNFLASDPARTWPVLHTTMALALGGRHRWNEMLFHDVHHYCPGRIGAMSQRGRFHGWEKVHDASVELLARGLWISDDAETAMDKNIRKRSLVIKARKDTSAQGN